MITLKQLRYLDALARHLHFGRAAAECAVSQPALSMQIAELERTLAVTLVERRPRGIALTPAGREIADRARRILNDVRDLGDFARQRNGVLTGDLSLGVIPTLAPYLLPDALTAIRAHYPHLHLRVREAQTRQLIDELQRGLLDAVIVALPVDDPEIETAVLFEDRFLLALPGNRIATTAPRVVADIVRNERLLLLEEGHCLREQALAVCELRTSDAIDTFGAASLSTLVQMVSHGLGLTLLPEIAVRVETRNSDIVLVRFVDPEPRRIIGLAWRRSSPRARDFSALISLLSDRSGPQAPLGPAKTTIAAGKSARRTKSPAPRSS